VERRWTLVVLAVLPITLGSAPHPSDTRAKAWAAPTKAIAQYDDAGRKMAQSVRAATKTLEGLSREQQAAVAAASPTGGRPRTSATVRPRPRRRQR
jgi:hypothetical protein